MKSIIFHALLLVWLVIASAIDSIPMWAVIPSIILPIVGMALSCPDKYKNTENID